MSSSQLGSKGITMTAPQPDMPLLHHFDQLASKYDYSTGGCTTEVLERLIPRLPPITSDSVILDNASGTGVAAAALLKSFPDIEKSNPTIHAVDGAPKMIEIAQARLAGHDNVHTDVARGEDLSLFPDDKFSHSLTIMGLFFFEDPLQGAREIYRTLAPGGTAVVTGWTHLGYLRPIHILQEAIRPRQPVFESPLPQKWLVPDTVKGILKEAGFPHVDTRLMRAHWAAEDKASLEKNFIDTYTPGFMADWTEMEKDMGMSLVPGVMRETSEEFLRIDGSTAVGLPMEAWVLTCRKP